jgi:hypothetical protein
MGRGLKEAARLFDLGRDQVGGYEAQAEETRDQEETREQQDRHQEGQEEAAV